jgi:hypothetical protein
MSFIDSQYVVPVAGTIMILGIVAVSKANEYGVRKLQYEERMTAIAKGLPIPELPAPEVPRANLRLRMANVRLGGIVTTCGGIGALIFFCVLATILQERDVLAGAAAALVPVAIGVGLLIDARAQEKELPQESHGPYPPQ